MENQNNLKMLYFLRAGIVALSVIFFLFTDVYAMFLRGFNGISLLEFFGDHAEGPLDCVLGIVTITLLIIPLFYSINKKEFFMSSILMFLCLISLTATKSSMLSDYGGILQPAIGFYMYLTCAFITLLITVFINVISNKGGKKFGVTKVSKPRKYVVGILYIKDDNLIFENNFIWKGEEVLTPVRNIAKIIKTSRGLIIYAKGIPYEFRCIYENKYIATEIEKVRKESFSSTDEPFRDLIKEGF